MYLGNCPRNPPPQPLPPHSMQGRRVHQLQALRPSTDDLANSAGHPSALSAGVEDGAIQLIACHIQVLHVFMQSKSSDNGLRECKNQPPWAFLLFHETNAKHTASCPFRRGLFRFEPSRERIGFPCTRNLDVHSPVRLRDPDPGAAARASSIQLEFLSGGKAHEKSRPSCPPPRERD